MSLISKLVRFRIWKNFSIFNVSKNKSKHFDSIFKELFIKIFSVQFLKVYLYKLIYLMVTVILITKNMIISKFKGILV